MARNAKPAPEGSEPERLPGVPDGLPAERVSTTTLNGVIVRGATMTEVLTDEVLMLREGAARAGETPDEAFARAIAAKTARTLARQVLTEKGQPLHTAEAWGQIPAKHRADVLMLYGVAVRLSGGDGSAEKN